MHETAIARFLAGEATAAALDGDGEPLQNDFEVDPEMLLRFVDAGLRGELSPEALKTAADVMLDSDRFVWADDIIVDVLSQWSDSMIDLADTRRWLTGEAQRERYRPVAAKNRRTLGTVMLICGGFCILCEAIVFIGNAAIGPRFIDSALGTNLFMVGIAFFAVAFVMIGAMAIMDRP
ncbi:MAG TPA: hypothetical protein VJZ76_23760 [Thermoanaerobaculia bacterium]|nr:hypothetical protein [Thermoanaerobaculia bacterium]